LIPSTPPTANQLSAHIARLLRHGPERAKAAMLLLLLALAGGLGLAGLPGAEGERAGPSASSNSAGRTTTPHALLVVASTAELPALPPAPTGGGHVLPVQAPALPLPGLAFVLLLATGLLWVARSIRTGQRQPTGPPLVLSR
jgi:hypothetical protein